MKTIRILVIHGPNLNLLGARETHIYGHVTLNDINKMIKDFASENNIEINIYHSNSEGDIIDFIQKNQDYDGLIINPAAYTHSSVAISDTIKAVKIPTVEVHLSNIYSREGFRSTSFIAPVCIGQISGFGYYSYLLGLEAIINYLNKTEST